MEKENELKEQEEINKNLIIENIIENYRRVEKSIVDQLSLYNKFHPTTTGSFREDIWRQLFEMIVPKKFVIEHSVFIIDSYCNISKEVDLAIIDNMYTPYIFRYGELKFIPIEAVAAVIECKSTSVSFSENSKEDTKENKSKQGLDVWCKSIEQLRTSINSIVRMAVGTIIKGSIDGGKSSPSTQTSTRPIRIFCGYKTKSNLEKIKEHFDFVLIANKEGIKVSAKNLNLQEWYKELDHYKPNKKEGEYKECEKLSEYDLNHFKVEDEEGEVSLLTFNFQLNQLLMIINNPILFPHMAYTDMFNKKGEKKD